MRSAGASAPRPGAAPSGLALALAAFALLVAACSSTGPSYEARPGAYDILTDAGVARLERARGHVDRGELESARAILLELRHGFPNNVGIGAMLQDVELEIDVQARAARAGDSLSPVRIRAEGRERQREQWRSLADNNPTAALLVLAARVEDDYPAAFHLLDLALEADPDCVWAHYARAHYLSKSGDWPAARLALDQALALDPGHLHARRLEVSVLARLAERQVVIEHLTSWLEAAREDPRISPDTVVGAQIDLALFLLLDGDEREARQILRRMQASDDEAVRRLCALAAAEQALGRPRQALAASRDAEELEPEQGLPVVQQAMLHELWLDDPIAARMDWERLLAGTGERPELGRLFLNMRARIAIERLESAEGARWAELSGENGQDEDAGPEEGGGGRLR